MDDYERLVLEVWTDGTIAPRDAIRDAAETLVNHFFLFSKIGDEHDEIGDHRTPPVTPEVYQTPIERLDLSPRTLNCLKRAHITKVGEVLEMSDDELLKIRNFGDKSLEELREKLIERGITPAGQQDDEGAEEPGVPALDSISSQDLGDLMGASDASLMSPAPMAQAQGEDTETVDWPDQNEDDPDA